MDRRRAAGEHRRERRRDQLRREAVVRTRRPADPPLRRGLGQGCRPHAAGSALLRRHQRARRPAGAGGAARVPPAGLDTDRRRAFRRRRARAAAAARDARPAHQRQGFLAQADQRAAGEPAQAAPRALAAARQDHRDRRGLAVAARRRACRTSRQARHGHHLRGAGDGIRHRFAARRFGAGEFRDALAGVSEAGRRDAGAPRGRRAEPAGAEHRGRADPGRNGAPRAGAPGAGAGCARDSDQPAPHGAGARRVLPRSLQARRPGHARARQQADRRRAQDAGARPRRAASVDVPGADRRVRQARHAGRERRPRASRRIAFRSRLFHRGRRAAAPRPRPADRADAGAPPRHGACACGGAGHRGGFGRRSRGRPARNAGSLPALARRPRRARAARSRAHDVARRRGDSRRQLASPRRRAPRWRSCPARARATPPRCRTRSPRSRSSTPPRRRRRRRKKRCACSRPMRPSSTPSFSTST